MGEFEGLRRVYGPFGRRRPPPSASSALRASSAFINVRGLDSQKGTT